MGERSQLYRTIAPLEKVMALNRHSKIPLFSFSQKEMVYSDATVVFAFEKIERF